MEITLVKGKKKTKHQMPTDWNDITLTQYVDVIKKAKEVGLRELEKVVKIICILTGIAEDDLYRLSTKDVAKLGGYVSHLLSSLPEDELKHIIEIDGREYGFHTKLADITMGEWVDIDTYITEGVEDNLHKIMSVLYRPIIAKDGDKYAIENYEPNEERQDLFKNKLMVGDFYGVSVFFSDLGKELLENSLKFSIKTTMKDKRDHLDTA